LVVCRLRAVAAEGGYEAVANFPHVAGKRIRQARRRSMGAAGPATRGSLAVVCARAIDAIRQRRTPVVPGERAVTARQTNWRHGMANKDTGYGRNWKKWLAIYAVAGVVVYLIVYLVFFSGGGGGAAGGGGLY
jgi:hypothetical protein